MASRKQEHIEQIREMSLLFKIFFSRNELREIENIVARDVDVLIANFLLQVREFLFLINFVLQNSFNENSPLTCNKQLMS